MSLVALYYLWHPYRPLSYLYHSVRPLSLASTSIFPAQKKRGICWKDNINMCLFVIYKAAAEAIQHISSPSIHATTCRHLSHVPRVDLSHVTTCQWQHVVISLHCSCSPNRACMSVCKICSLYLKSDIWTIVDPVRLDLRYSLYLARN